MEVKKGVWHHQYRFKTCLQSTKHYYRKVADFTHTSRRKCYYIHDRWIFGLSVNLKERSRLNIKHSRSVKTLKLCINLALSQTFGRSNIV